MVLTFPDVTGAGAATCPTGMQNATPAILVLFEPWPFCVVGAAAGGTGKDIPVALIWFVGMDAMVLCEGSGVGLICGDCC